MWWHVPPSRLSTDRDVVAPGLLLQLGVFIFCPLDGEPLTSDGRPGSPNRGPPDCFGARRRGTTCSGVRHPARFRIIPRGVYSEVGRADGRGETSNVRRHSAPEFIAG